MYLFSDMLLYIELCIITLITDFDFCLKDSTYFFIISIYSSSLHIFLMFYFFFNAAINVKQ